MYVINSCSIVYRGKKRSWNRRGIIMITSMIRVTHHPKAPNRPIPVSWLWSQHLLYLRKKSIYASWALLPDMVAGVGNSVGNGVWTSVVLFIVILDGSGGPLVVKWWKHTIWGSRHIVSSLCYHFLLFGIIYLKVFICRVYKNKITKKNIPEALEPLLLFPFVWHNLPKSIH